MSILMTSKVVFLLGNETSDSFTVINELLKEDGLVYIPSYTTKDLKEGEINGEQYRHISKEEFEQAIKSGDFLEYVSCDGDYFGTKISSIHEAFTDDMIPIKVIDIEGLETIGDTQSLQEDQYVSIFLDVDEVVMTQRILTKNQNVDADTLQHILEKAEMEREKADELCDHIVDASQESGEIVLAVKHIVSSLI